MPQDGFTRWHQPTTTVCFTTTSQLTHRTTDINIEVPSQQQTNIDSIVDSNVVETEKPVVNIQFLQRRDQIVGIVLWSFSLLYHVILLLSNILFFKKKVTLIRWFSSCELCIPRVLPHIHVQLCISKSTHAWPKYHTSWSQLTRVEYWLSIPYAPTYTLTTILSVLSLILQITMQIVFVAGKTDFYVGIGKRILNDFGVYRFGDEWSGKLME
jgi:hypothetical protein